MKSNTTAANKELSGVIQINEGQIQDHLGRIVRGAVEDTLNAMLAGCQNVRMAQNLSFTIKCGVIKANTEWKIQRWMVKCWR